MAMRLFCDLENKENTHSFFLVLNLMSPKARDTAISPQILPLLIWRHHRQDIPLGQFKFQIYYIPKTKSLTSCSQFMQISKEKLYLSPKIQGMNYNNGLSMSIIKGFQKQLKRSVQNQGIKNRKHTHPPASLTRLISWREVLLLPYGRWELVSASAFPECDRTFVTNRHGKREVGCHWSYELIEKNGH